MRINSLARNVFKNKRLESLTARADMKTFPNAVNTAVIDSVVDNFVLDVMIRNISELSEMIYPGHQYSDPPKIYSYISFFLFCEKK